MTAPAHRPDGKAAAVKDPFSAAAGPLIGVRVLDFTHVVAGPFATRLLADMGAEVVKVESTRGDLMRQLPVSYDELLSSAFAQYNCGKQSIALDLTAPEAIDSVLTLVDDVDVVVENFAPGTMQRFGLGYDVLQARRPGLVMCSISTFGAFGPYAAGSGFGLEAEAASGLMSLTGEDGGPPMHFGTPLADLNSGVHAVAAIGAALFRQARTGVGCHIDLSSFDALVAMIDQAVGLENFSDGELTFGRYGTRHPTTVPSGVLPTANGHVSYGCPGDRFFAALAQAMGRPELTEDPRFATPVDRMHNADEVYDAVESWAADWEDAETLVTHLRSHGVSAARVRRIDEVRQDPHLIARGMLAPVQFDGVGERLVQSAPYRLSNGHVGPAGAAPHLGEHTRAVLHGAGIDHHVVEEMIRQRVAVAWPTSRGAEE